MANPADVLHQLQAKLFSKYMVKNAEVKSPDDLEEDIGNNPSGATASGFGSNLANQRYSGDTQDTDVEDAEDVDAPYTTHRGITLPTDDYAKYSPNKISIDRKTKVENIFAQLEQAVAAAEKEPPEEGMTVTDPGADAPGHTDYEGGEAPAEVDVEVTPEEPMPAMGGGMPGMEEEEKQTPSELGRIYELKKIYTRLTTIESYLSESSDPELLRMRLLVSKSIELFEILASNIPSYKPPKAPPERIDEIIIMYYKFLKQVYESVAKYYKARQSKLKDDGLLKTNIKISDEELV